MVPYENTENEGEPMLLKGHRKTDGQYPRNKIAAGPVSSGCRPYTGARLQMAMPKALGPVWLPMLNASGS